MTGLSPITRLWSEGVRQLRLLGWKWARRELPHTLGADHPDMNRIVLEIAKLERPPVLVRPRSPCEEVWGLCAGDPNCKKRHCPGRMYGLHHTGVQARGPGR